MPEKFFVRREISFSPRSARSTVDVVPIGFELFTHFVQVVESFYESRSLSSELALFCLTDTVFLDGDGDEETPVQEIRPFLRAHYEQVKSQPIGWFSPEESFEEMIQFEISTHRTAKSISDRIQLLENCLLELGDDKIPLWFVAFKTDYERGVPSYYHFEIAYREGSALIQFDWSTWRGGRHLIGLETNTVAEEENDA